MALIIETYESREATVGVESPSVDLQFIVLGTELDTEVRALVEATIPAIYGGLFFQSYHIAHQGGGVWEASARYGKVEQKEPGESSYSFDTGGGTQKITQSLETVNKYAASGSTAPDFKGAIGVTHDNVEGVDITTPVYNFSETHYLAPAVVTNAYKSTLFGLTGKVNSDAFRGFAAGEVLFLGASGTRRGTGSDDDWEISFRFAASKNRSNLTVGDISGISKKGWEYLWVRYADDVDDTAKALIKKPVAAYVEKVYDDAAFAALGI